MMGVFLQRLGLLGGGGEEITTYNPAWENVDFLYSWEDIVGSPTEESSNARGLTNYGTSVDSSRKLFDKNSTLFNNTDWVNTQNGIFHFTTGDIVVETWIYISGTISGSGFICGNYDWNNRRNWSFQVGNDAGGNILAFTIYPDSAGGAGAVSTIGPSITKDRWVHCAFQRSGDDHLCFVDGVPGTLITTTDRPSGAGIVWMTWGRTSNASNQLSASLAESRITQFEAFYPAGGFTPPPAPFPRS